jgi:hypothetical protein
MKTDVNYHSFVEQTDLVIDSWENPENPNDYDDVMKFSNCENVHVKNVTINGGMEDCIDAVRGKGYLFENLTLCPYRNGITIKGSVDGWHLKNISFERKGVDYTIEIGQYDNYWTVSTPPTRNGVIENVNLQNGGKVYVWVWHGEKPRVVDSPNVRVIKIPAIVWFPYFVFRSIQRQGFSFVKESFKKLFN